MPRLASNAGAARSDYFPLLAGSIAVVRSSLLDSFIGEAFGFVQGCLKTGEKRCVRLAELYGDGEIRGGVLTDQAIDIVGVISF
jgi:hypothetical protein